MAKEIKYSVNEAIDRLENVAKAKGMTTFARVDFSALGKNSSDMNMPPNQLLIFGKGTGEPKLITAAPLAALDFPLRAVAWEEVVERCGYVTVTRTLQNTDTRSTNKAIAIVEINSTLDSVTAQALK